MSFLTSLSYEAQLVVIFQAASDTKRAASLLVRENCFRHKACFWVTNNVVLKGLEKTMFAKHTKRRQNRKRQQIENKKKSTNKNKKKSFLTTLFYEAKFVAIFQAASDKKKQHHDLSTRLVFVTRHAFGSQTMLF